MAYRLKSVQYQKATRHILLQNENGPCPLLAAANALLLGGTIELSWDCISAGVASLDDISNVLAEHAIQTSTTSKECDDEHHSFHLNELMSIFPTLQDGVDINPKFTAGVSGMEYTSQLTVFEILRIQIVHGWLLDPQDKEMFKLIDNRTYNQLVELVIAGKDAEAHLDKVTDEITRLQRQLEALRQQQTSTSPESGQPHMNFSGANGELHVSVPTGSAKGLNEPHDLQAPRLVLPETIYSTANITEQELSEKTALFNQLEEKATTGTHIAHFLEATCHQLTTYGLMELYRQVEPDSLCAFFRNNHFCTITKHDDVLYLLVTDLGYANVPEIMWEKLDAIDGDTEYMTPLFTKSEFQSGLLPPSSSLSPSPEALLAQRAQNNYDMQVAMQLSNEPSSARIKNSVSHTDNEHDLEATKQSSLLKLNYECGGSIDDVDADRRAAEELQAHLNESSLEEASIALARALQEEEYSRGSSSHHTTNATRRATNNQPADKSNCCIA